MSDHVVYGNTILKGINKAGTLKPDENGYYTVVLGALGVVNSAGEEYVDTATSTATFSPGSTLQRRISQGLLRAEFGHPDPTQFPNAMAFERRIRMIQEDRICCHIAELWLGDIEWEGRKLKGIIARIRPSGPFGPALKDMLDNPEENVTFSGRYYSNLGTANGRRTREIHTVATWDFVSEPGVAPSMKYLSPSLESMHDTMIFKDQLQEAIQEEESNSELATSLENGGVSAKDLFKDLGFGVQNNTSKVLDW